MSANKAKNTKPELILRSALFALGLRGLRSNPKNIFGRPDIVYSKNKVAIFVHGCYWHHCPKCDFPLPKHNRGFWKKKFSRNKERDAEKLSLLRKVGWKTFVVWEHEVKRGVDRVAMRVARKINHQTPRSS